MSEPTDSGVNRPSVQAQTSIGFLLAGLIMMSWLVLHVGAVFFYTWDAHSVLTAPLLVALLCWLYVGLFIVAHDCMHGSLAPYQPGLNRLVGSFCLAVYAGFSFDKLNKAHHRHHRFAGTAEDPDFDDRAPHGFWAWYLRFFLEYFSLRELLIIAAVVALYVFVFGAAYANIIVFWALPALLSSIQLFTFGTYLPHRPGHDAFLDRHRTRSNRYGWFVSLLTCFHFGYHHEHHLHPTEPWWRLPALRNG